MSHTHFSDHSHGSTTRWVRYSNPQRCGESYTLVRWSQPVHVCVCARVHVVRGPAAAPTGSGIWYRDKKRR